MFFWSFDINFLKYGAKPLSGEVGSEYEYPTPTPTEDPNQNFEEEEQVLIIDSGSLEKEEKDKKDKEIETSFKQISHDIKEANAQSGKNQIIAFKKKPESFIIRIALDLNWLDKNSIRAMGVDEKRPLIIEVYSLHFF